MAWGVDAGSGVRNQPRIGISETSHGGFNPNENYNHNLNRFRLSYTAALDAVTDPIPPLVRALLNVPRADTVARVAQGLGLPV